MGLIDCQTTETKKLRHGACKEPGMPKGTKEAHREWNMIGTDVGKL